MKTVTAIYSRIIQFRKTISLLASIVLSALIPQILQAGAPGTQANTVTFSNIEGTQVQVTWTRGNGTDCAAFIYKGAAGSAAPVNNTTYTPNTIYGSGTQIGATGWYCIYTGTGTTVTVTSLTAGSTYRVMVCEYNAGPTYLTSTVATNPANVVPALAAQTITFGALATVTYGVAPYSLTATASSGLAVTYTSSNPAVATVTGSTITIVGAGSTNITASQVGNANFSAAANVVQPLTVNPKNQTITFGALAAVTYGVAPYALTATGGASGNAVTYTSSNLAVATVTGSTITIVGAGSTNITASQAGNGNYNAATPVVQALTVNMANQTITFTAFATPVTYGAAPFNLTATSTSGLTVTFSSSNTAVATVSGNTVTIVGAGSANITASQAGNTNYNAAANVVKALTVNTATQTITFGALTAVTYGVAPYTLTATGGASGNAVTYTSSNTAVATVSGNTITIVGAGTTNITASQAGNTDYSAAVNVVQGLTVNKANQTITFTTFTTPVTYGSAPFSLSATSTSGLAVTFTSSNTAVATVSGSTVTIVAPGTTNITAAQAGNANYNAATSVVQTLTVNKANQTITFTTITSPLTYGAAAFNLTATSSSGLAITFTSSNAAIASVAGSTVTIKGAGSVNLTASQAGNADYNAATSVVQTLVINPAPLTSTANNLSKIYNTANPALTITYTGFQYSDTKANLTTQPTIATTAVTASPVGTYPITLTGGSSSNYTITLVNGTLTVTQAAQTITFNALANKVYGSAAFNLSATASSGLAITYTSSNPAVATISGNTVTIVGAGTTNITASQAGNANYTAAANVIQPFTVTQATQTVPFTLTSPKTFTLTPLTLTQNSSVGLPITYTSSNTSVAAFIGDQLIYEGLGTTIITASQAGNNNYSAATPVAKTLQVNIGTQTITFPALPGGIVVGTPEFMPTATVTSDLPITFTSSNDNVAEIVNDSIVIIGIGTSTITASQPGDIDFSAATNKTETLTVNKGSQTITFPPLDTVPVVSPAINPGATASSLLPVTYSSSNIAVATIVDGLIQIIGVGTANITASQSGNNNYNAAPNVTRPIVVVMANDTILFDSLPTVIYGNYEINPGGTTSSGLPITYTSDNTNVASISGEMIQIKGVGSAHITASQPGNFDYNPAISVVQLFIVNQSPDTIDFHTLSGRYYGTADYNPGATCSSGLPITYISSNTNVVSIINGKIHIVNPGTVDITATQPGNTDYLSAPSISRVLTIYQDTQTITFNRINLLDTLTYGDPDVNLISTSSSGLTVKDSSNNPAVATIINGKFHIVQPGTVDIIASQPGNNYYSAAPEVIQVITINKDIQTITFGALPVINYKDTSFIPVASTTSGLPVTFTSSNPAIASIYDGKIQINAAGSVQITASQAGNVDYDAAINVTQTLTINKVNQVLTFNSLPLMVYGDVDFNPGAFSNVGLPIIYTSSDTSVATIVNGLIHIKNSGTTNITASQAGNGDYNSTFVVQPLTVSKATQILTFVTLPVKSFGDSTFTPEAYVNTGLGIIYSSSNINVANIVAGQIQIVGAGTAYITATQPGNLDYNLASATQLFTVNKEIQTITFNPLPAETYGNAAFYPVASSSSGLPLTFSSSNPNVATIVNGKINITGTGTANIIASQPGNLNYDTAVNVSSLLTVEKDSQTITFAPLPVKIFGNPDFNAVATSSSGAQIVFTSDNANVATIVNGEIHITGAGTVNITASQTGNNNYKPASSVSQILTVNKENQTIIFGNIPVKIFGSPDFIIPASSTSGLSLSFSSDNTNVAIIVDDSVHIVGVGSAHITASQPGNSDFNAAFSVSQYLLVTETSQTITFDLIPHQIYGNPDFNPGAVSSSGLPVIYYSSNANVATIVDGLIHIIGVGTDTITASQPGNATYGPAIFNPTQVLTVSKAVLTVTADNASRKYDVPNPTFTCWYSGFVNGEDVTDLSETPAVSTDATITSLPGTYKIIPVGGVDQNYDFEYVDGTLTIGSNPPASPAIPTGPASVCISAPSQVYKTNGAADATSYIWSITPTDAANFNGNGQTITFTFNTSFTGRCAITVKGQNPSGLSESSDTLYVTVIPSPSAVQIDMKNTYCSNQSGDSIFIVNSEKGYLYQLYLDGSIIDTAIHGNGSKIGWEELKQGTYSINEEICNISVADNLIIKEISNNTTTPQVASKWNDVIICLSNTDSVSSYEWFKNSILISGDNQQYIWTQQQQGYYSVKTTDLNGCQSLMSDSIYVQPALGSVYPNPCQGQFTLSISNFDNGKVSVKLYSLNSTLLKSLTYMKDGETFQQVINVSELNIGAYFVEVDLNGQRVIFEKLIVE